MQTTHRPNGHLERSAAAPPQPTIAWDLARVGAVCEAVASWVGARLSASSAKTMWELGITGFAPSLAARAIGSELGARAQGGTTGSTEEIVCESASNAVLVYAEGALATAVTRGTEGIDLLAEALSSSIDQVRSGALSADLHVTWGMVENNLASTIPEVCAKMAEHGIDGEGLRWAVITFESHKHIRLIWQQAYKLTKVMPDKNPADLIGWGWHGLRVALDKFEPHRGYTFATYACPRINGAMRDGARSEGPLPKRLTTYQRKVAKAQDDLTYRLGRVPSLAELEAELGDDANSLHLMPRLSPAASIEEMTDGAQDRPHLAHAFVHSGPDPADLAIAGAQAAAIQRALGRLPADERQAVDLLVYQGLPVAAVIEMTGIAPRMLRARKERGLAALSGLLAEWAPVPA